MERLVTPPRRSTSPSRGPLPLCEQALNWHIERGCKQRHLSLELSGKGSPFRFNVIWNAVIWLGPSCEVTEVTDQHQNITRSSHSLHQTGCFLRKIEETCLILGHFLAVSYRYWATSRTRGAHDKENKTSLYSWNDFYTDRVIFRLVFRRNQTFPANHKSCMRN